MSSLIGLGTVILADLPPLLAATTGLLIVAFAGDKLLERRVSASHRLFLYVPVLARAALPLAWASPVGLLRAPAVTVVGAGAPLTSVAAAHDPARWVALAYLLGALALLARWTHARLVLARTLRAARPVEIGGIAVLVHDRIGPVVAGVVRPRIVVPASVVADTGLPLVLRHEAAHVARRDPLLGALLQLACIAAWPLLPVWIAARRMRALMELASDERALAGADRALRRQYGELLLALADPQAPSRSLLAGLAFGSDLKSRLRALASPRRWPAVTQAALVAALGALALACSGNATQTASTDEDPPPATLQGKLAPEAVVGVIKEHINEIKGCYERELVRQPRLGGKVVVKFTIAATGAVVASVLENSTMRAPVVESCVVKAVTRWRFPKPEGGMVSVSYPFVFTPSR
jgi:TonB family protein